MYIHTYNVYIKYFLRLTIYLRKCIHFLKIYLFLFIKIFYLFTFRGRGREGEREEVEHQCMFAYSTPHTGDMACNPGMCPDWELNW